MASDPAARPRLGLSGDFLRLWAGQTISIFGDQFTGLALPLIAVLSLRATPAEMGLLGAATTAPFLFFGLVVGVLVDRHRRRPILILGDAGRGVLVASIALMSLAGLLQIPYLLVLGFMTGILTVFFDVAYQAYLPAIVSREELVGANSRLEATNSTAAVVGPSAAGLVIRILGAPFAMLFDAATFLVSAGFLSTIRKTEPVPAAEARPKMLSGIAEGLAVVFRDPRLRSIAGCTSTANFFSASIFALYILYVVRDLRLDAIAIGLIFGLSGFGAVAGSVAAGRLAKRFGVGPTIVGGAAISGVSGIGLLLATPPGAEPVLIVTQLFLTFGSVVYNINQVSLRQGLVPLRLQGRLNATMRFLVWGTLPLGSLMGGFLGTVLGLKPAIAIGIIGGALAVFWVLFSPVRDLRTMPNPDV